MSETLTRVNKGSKIYGRRTTFEGLRVEVETRDRRKQDVGTVEDNVQCSLYCIEVCLVHYKGRLVESTVIRCRVIYYTRS